MIQVQVRVRGATTDDRGEGVRREAPGSDGRTGIVREGHVATKMRSKIHAVIWAARP